MLCLTYCINVFQLRSISLSSSRALVQCHDHGLLVINRQQQHQQPRLSAVLGELHRRSYAQQKAARPRGGRESGGNDSGSDSDSDSDNEKRDRVTSGSAVQVQTITLNCIIVLQGSSKFWLRKMRTFHGLLDVNKDGVIGYDDYKLLATKFTALGHLSAEASKEFQEVMDKLWEEQWGENTPYNLISVEKYLSEMQHVMNDDALKKKVHRFLPYLFQAVDKDASGFISIKEFKLFFKCLGLTEQDAVRSFAAIDVNSDGSLSMKEFVKLGRDFFVTEDERRVSKQFWGPLVGK